MKRLIHWAGMLCFFELASLSLPGAISPSPAVQDAMKLARPALRVFGEAEGLPNPTVYALHQDRQGHLWAGTQDGAAVFTGSTWTPVHMPPGSTSNLIRAVLETRDGSRWFGTEHDGLWRLLDGTWTRFRGGAELPSERVNGLTEIQGEHGPVLWVSTSKGVARLEDGRWTRMGRESGLPHEWVWRIVETSKPSGKRTLWAATNRGLARWENGHWKPMEASAGFPVSEVNGIAEVPRPDGGCDLWISVWGGGLRRWDGERWEVFDPFHGFPSFNPVDIVCTLTGPQHRPIVWVPTYDAGLLWLVDGTWRALNARNGLPSNGIYCVQPSRDGKPTLWFGLRGGGVASLDLGGWCTLDHRTGLPNDEVSSICEARESDGTSTLWVGTNDGLAHWSQGGWHWERREAGLPSNHIVSLLAAEGPGGGQTVWAGTLKGLGRREGGRWRTFDFGGKLKDEQFYSLLASAEGDGRTTIWAGTEGGLLRLRGSSWRLFTSSDGLPDDRVYALLETLDRNGERSLWVGTRGGGVGCLRNGLWTRYDANRGLPNPSVYSLHLQRALDGRRWLWASTFGGGLARLDVDSPDARWDVYDRRNLPGLPSNAVLSIEEDSAGRLYAFTEQGIARMTCTGPDARPSVEATFDLGDGLPALACSSGVSLRDHLGRLWFPTSKGVAILDPRLEVEAPVPPPLVLDHVWVAGRERILSPGATFDHHENRLAFEFDLPFFHRADETRYRTQLIGIESEPTAWTSEGKREFLALPHGSYIFRCWARDFRGRVSAPLDLPFRIKPAPWQSVWAYVLYILAGASVLFALSWLRIRILHERNRELEAMVTSATAELREKNEQLKLVNDEKTQFMGIAAHDLKNPLNVVLLSSQQLAEPDVVAEDVTYFAHLIEKATRQMADLVKNLLDLNRMDTGRLRLTPQPVDISAMADEVCRSFGPPASAKGIPILLEGAEQKLVAWADPVHLREVLENFISNSIKFTPIGPPQRHIWVRVGSRDGQVLLEVQDEGPGFTQEDKAKAFGRFARLSATPTAGETSTGLGLSIVKALVEAMDGRVELESEAGRGATFRVALPQPPTTEA